MAMDPATVEKIRKKAGEAVQAKNYDYAVELYHQILAANPDSAADRKFLRTVQRKVFLEKGGSGTFGKLMGKMTGAKLEAAKLSKNPQKIFDEAEKILEKDPFDNAALRALGEAAIALKWDETAVYAFEDILEREKDDVETLRALGHFWFDRDHQKASKYFERVRRIVPEDKEAHQAIRNLAARTTMKQGVENATLKTGDYHDMLKNKEQALKIEHQHKVAKTADEIARAVDMLKADLAEKPKDPRLWVRLADEYVKTKAFAQAREALAKAQEIDNANLTIKFRLGDVILREMDEEILRADEELAKNPADEALKARSAELKTKRLATAVADFAERARAYPTDLDVRYRYGEALFRAGRVKEAIPEFQQAANDPKRKRAALIFLGNAFLREGMVDLAETQLLRALEGKFTMDDEGKLIHYQLGLVNERLKRPDKAKELYQKILAADFNFKDVTERLKKLDGGGTSPQ